MSNEWGHCPHGRVGFCVICDQDLAREEADQLQQRVRELEQELSRYHELEAIVRKAILTPLNWRDLTAQVGHALDALRGAGGKK